MITQTEILIKVNVRNISKLRMELDKELKLGDQATIPISLLDHGSHIKVNCKCDICGREKDIMYQKYVKNIKNGGFYSCSSKCAQSKVKNTNLEKFGQEYYTKTKEYSQRVKETNTLKYESEYYLSSNIGKKTISEKNLEKWGVENPFQSEEIKERIKETCLQKWGVDNPSKSNEIKSKLSESNKKSWQNKFKNFYKSNHNLDIIDYDDSGIYTIQCLKNHQYQITNRLLSNRIIVNTEPCLVCNPYQTSNTSGYEEQLFDFILKNLEVEIIRNSRNIIKPYEIDIYIPQLKLAFEFNGLYWHSDERKSKNYHYLKHKLCKELDIELIQIWEDDWKYKQEIVKSIILNKIKINKNKIYARNCEIKFLNFTDADKFLKANHLMSSCRSKYNIGLIYNNEIVSIMCFGKLRKSLGSISKNEDYEMYRFCNKLDTSIIGGASKMMSFFLKKIDFDNIFTYFDKSLGHNNLYEKIGFEFISETPIGYHYIQQGIRKHRYNFRKEKLVKLGFDKSKTEMEITHEMGLKKVYNSGSYKYQFRKN